MTPCIGPHSPVAAIWRSPVDNPLGPTREHAATCAVRVAAFCDPDEQTIHEFISFMTDDRCRTPQPAPDPARLFRSRDRHCAVFVTVAVQMTTAGQVSWPPVGRSDGH
jgi:hypothetical protein